MRKKVIPTYYATSLYEIDIEFFIKNNIKYIFSDLDNTLDSYKQKVPSSKAIELKDKLTKNGITLIIASNNNGPRVRNYSEALGVEYYANLGKPFGIRLRKRLKENNIDLNQALLVGDQLMTDIKCGNACGIRTLLTEPLVNEDQWQTKFNRMFDRPVRKRLKKKNLLLLWKDVK